MEILFKNSIKHNFYDNWTTNSSKANCKAIHPRIRKVCFLAKNFFSAGFCQECQLCPVVDVEVKSVGDILHMKMTYGTPR